MNTLKHTTTPNKRKPLSLPLLLLAVCALLLLPGTEAKAANDVNDSALTEATASTATDSNSQDDEDKDTDIKSAPVITVGKAKKEKSIQATEEVDASLLQEVEEDEEHPHYTVRTTSGSKRLADEYQDYTYEMCEKYGIEEYYNIILTQMYCESSYNQNAVSSARSYGLMQIHASNFSRLQTALGLTNIKDPLQNIEAGVYMMAGYIAKYGDVQTALVCYHRGERAAKRGMRSDRYSAHIVSLSTSLIES